VAYAPAKHNTLQEVSRVCKIPANRDIFYATIFLIFQDIRLGCCMVAAHIGPLVLARIEERLVFSELSTYALWIADPAGLAP
jgi:hypothetical protein